MLSLSVPAQPGKTLTVFEKAGIDVISGAARFHEENTLDIDGRKVSARFFVTASGARPMPLPIEGIDKIPVFTKEYFLGAHILVDNSAGIISTIRLAMLNRIPVGTLYQQSIMSPYPSRESDMLYMLRSLSPKK